MVEKIYSTDSMFACSTISMLIFPFSDVHRFVEMACNLHSDAIWLAACRAVTPSFLNSAVRIQVHHRHRTSSVLCTGSLVWSSRWNNNMAGNMQQQELQQQVHNLLSILHKSFIKNFHYSALIWYCAHACHGTHERGLARIKQDSLCILNTWIYINLCHFAYSDERKYKVSGIYYFKEEHFHRINYEWTQVGY